MLSVGAMPVRICAPAATIPSGLNSLVVQFNFRLPVYVASLNEQVSTKCLEGSSHESKDCFGHSLFLLGKIGTVEIKSISIY